MSVGSIVLMVISLFFVISGFIFFVIMDFKNHKKKNDKKKNNEADVETN